MKTSATQLWELKNNIAAVHLQEIENSMLGVIRKLGIYVNFFKK